MRTFIGLAVVAVAVAASPTEARAADATGYLHGTIITIDDERHTGLLRWDDEEVFWTDHFNSSKLRNRYLDYLTDEEIAYVRRQGIGDAPGWVGDFVEFVSSFESANIDVGGHQFVAQFGDLAAIDIHGGDAVTVHLKDGARIELEGGSNDIDTDVFLLDPRGERTFRWRRISRVEFHPPESEPERLFGDALWGVVETRWGDYEGWVQWDHDERLSTDVLDGDTRSGSDVSVPFGQIRSITARSNGSDVEYTDGSTEYLTGSNDVDDDNRGIIVTLPGVGRIDIPWESFRKVSFAEAPDRLKAYDEFPAPRALLGTVVTVDGETHSGRIAYDLDESYDLEILDGDYEDMEYAIPFRNIATIQRMNRLSSTVTLRSGEELRLRDGQDVAEGHDGILVFVADEAPVYVPWEDMQRVEFD